MAQEVPDGSIVITPKEFYDGVSADIGAIRVNVSGLREELSGLPARVERLEVEVNSLRSRQVWFAGFIAGGGGTVGAVLTKFFS